MSAAMLAPQQPPRLTVEEFIRDYGPRPERWELVEGEPRLMAGSTPRHAEITLNVGVALRARLGGTGCRPFVNDLLLETSPDGARLPGVGIYCDPRDLDHRDDEMRAFKYPRVVFEVLSPSTRATDMSEKLDEYQSLETVETIVFIDPRRQNFETWDRLGVNEWRNIKHFPGAGLALRDPALTIPATEIFARG